MKTLAAEPPIKPGTPDPYTPPKPGTYKPETHLQLGAIVQFVTALVEEHDELPDPQPRDRTPERMSQEGAPAAGETPGAGATERQCLLLACFAGAKRAAKIHRELNKRIDQGGDALLEQVVVKVDSKHKVQVHDPRRVVAGTLTPALTWGIFGLLAGGLKGLAIWAVVGAICGGLYAYYFEHLLTKDELKRIGGRLPVDSSAIVAFVRAADPRRLLSSAASFEPATASVAEIAPDLSAQVHSGVAQPGETSAARARAGGAIPGCRPGDADGALHRRARREAGVGRVRIREAQETRRSRRWSCSSRRTSTAGVG